MNFKENARPLAMVLLIIGLIGMAVGEACGYPAVEWFRAFALSVVGEWFLERGIRKSIGKE